MKTFMQSTPKDKHIPLNCLEDISLLLISWQGTLMTGGLVTQSHQIQMLRFYPLLSFFSSLSKIALREPCRRGARLFHLPVADVISAGVVDLDDDKHMLEMRADVFGSERKGPGLLEYYGDDIIANVPLP